MYIILAYFKLIIWYLFVIAHPVHRIKFIALLLLFVIATPVHRIKFITIANRL